MHHKSLIFLIQSRCRKLLLIDDLYPPGRGQRLCGAISPLDKLPRCKPYVCTAESRERHPQDHFHSGVGHQKGLLEEPNLSQLVLEQKACYDHPEGIQARSVDLLNSDISLPDGVRDSWHRRCLVLNLSELNRVSNARNGPKNG